MRQDLLGYLTDSLEAGERQRVESALQHDPALQQELETIRESLHPLECYQGDFDPPDGLADVTCQLVAEHRKQNQDVTVPSTAPAAKLSTPAASPAPAAQLSSVHEPPARRSRWSFVDLSVAGGVFIAAGLLLLPAMEQSRVAAQRTTCQNNLMKMGEAAIWYSDVHQGRFPELDESGNLAAAGVFPVRLLDGGFLDDRSQLVCPTSRMAESNRLPEVPSLDELQAATGRTLRRYHLTMGGDYAYPLGYVENGKYQSALNKHRDDFPIVADAPSSNHGGSGQNVLSEDGRVEWTTTTVAGEYNDDFYVNDVGLVAAGRHSDDAVCARSPVRPAVKVVLRLREVSSPMKVNE